MRESDVVEVGGPTSDTGARPWTLRALVAVAAGAALVNAGLTGVLTWETRAEWKQNRQVYCLSYLSDGSGGVERYEDLDDYHRGIVDTLDCAVPGR
jgi:hypothetical protein